MRRWYVTVRPDDSVFLTAYGDNGSHFAFDAALLPEDAADIEDILNRGEQEIEKIRNEAERRSA